MRGRGEVARKSKHAESEKTFKAKKITFVPDEKICRLHIKVNQPRRVHMPQRLPDIVQNLPNRRLGYLTPYGKLAAAEQIRGTKTKESTKEAGAANGGRSGSVFYCCYFYRLCCQISTSI